MSRPARSSSLDLASGKADSQVSDECILCLSTPVAGHHTPSSFLQHPQSLVTAVTMPVGHASSVRAENPFQQQQQLSQHSLLLS